MINTPDIDYGALSPVIALVAGICVVLLVGLIGSHGRRRLSSGLTLLTLAATAGLMIWRLGEPDVDLVAGALRSDGLSLTIGLIVVASAALVVPMQLRDPAAEESGFDAVTTEQIAGRAGVSPRTFFNYFATKEGAVLGTTPADLDELRAQLDARPADEPILDSIRVLVRDRLAPSSAPAGTARRSRRAIAQQRTAHRPCRGCRPPA